MEVFTVPFAFRTITGHFNLLTVAFLPAFIASYVAIFVERPSRRGLLTLYVTNVVSICDWNLTTKCHLRGFCIEKSCFDHGLPTSPSSRVLRLTPSGIKRVAVISAKNHKGQRRNRQSVTAKRQKSQTPKVLTAILTLPNLT